MSNVRALKYVRMNISANHTDHSTWNEDKRLEFCFWHQTLLSSHRPANPSTSGSSIQSSVPLKSVPSFKWKKRGKKKYFFSFFHERKTTLMKRKKKKLKFFLFYYFLFFSNSRHSVCQYPNLSIFTLGFSVWTLRHISYWTICSYANGLHHSWQYFNTETHPFWLREQPPSPNQW